MNATTRQFNLKTIEFMTKKADGPVTLFTEGLTITNALRDTPKVHWELVVEFALHRC